MFMPINRVGMYLLSVVTIFHAVPTTAQAAGSAKETSWNTRGAFSALIAVDAFASAAWYRDKLGFKTLSEGTAPNGTRFALLRHNEDLLEILTPPKLAVGEPVDRVERFRRVSIVKLGYTVTDLDALAKQLQGAGVTFSHGIVKPANNPFRTFAVLDPDGNVVQFFGR